MQSKAKRFSSKHFVLLLAGTQLQNNRLGVIITRKIEKRATRRNLLRRRLREFFRKNQQKLTKTFDMVIIARRQAELLNYAQIESELVGLLMRGRFLKS